MSLLELASLWVVISVKIRSLTLDLPRPHVSGIRTRISYSCC